MRFKKWIFSVILIWGTCCGIVLVGCAPKEEADSDKEAVVEQEEQPRQEEPVESVENLGTFSMQDINGETYTQDMFEGYELTMINVFTTWCTPCINEIPYLDELSKDMADQSVQVVGIALDTIGQSGGADQEAVEKAKLLAKKTEAAYPFLIPDEGYLNGRLAGINAVPETFFVDREGNIIGETYTGSRSYDEWKDIIEKELEGADNGTS